MLIFHSAGVFSPDCIRSKFDFRRVYDGLVFKNLPAVQETWGLFPGLGRSPEKGMATYSIFLPGEFHGQRSLASTVTGVAKSGTRLTLSLYMISISCLGTFYLQRRILIGQTSAYLKVG